MAEGLLDFLKNKNGFVSGQEIADELKISRNAVWKAVNKVRAEGFEIEAVPRKGYRLTGESDAFGKEAIRSHLKTRWLGRGDRLIFYKETDSTNDEAIRRTAGGFEEGLLITADVQTAGKGRRGRQWKNPAGVNTAMSYLLKPDLHPDRAPMLTLVMALACERAIKDLTGTEPGIKWPNDIVLNGKKLVGILTEMGLEEDYIKYVVIGTGINVNQGDFPEEIAETATSLFLETGKRWSRSELTAECANRFEYYYDEFLKHGSLETLKDEYNSVCVNSGKKVRVLDPKGEYEGTAKGIDEKGNLIVIAEDGSLKEVYSGEVSVRGVYGYV